MNATILLCLLGSLASSVVGIPEGYGQNCHYVEDVQYVTVYENVCKTEYEHVCKTAYRRHCEPHQEQKCHVEQKRHCEDKRKRECHTEYRTTYETYYEKECVYYKCRKVEKKRPKKEPYQECEYKTYQDCRDVPEKKCSYVTEERCQNRPYQDCEDVPKKKCKKEPKRVPKVTKKKVCSNSGHDTRRNAYYRY